MSPTLLVAATLMTPAADPPADTAKADEAIHKYLAAETRRLSERFMDGAKTRAEWEAKRPKLKEQFLDMLGLWPLPEKTPLQATVTGTLERGDVVIDKLHFQSQLGLYVTGNLYRPKAPPKDKKLPAILYVCGHSGRGRDGNKTAFQDHGMWFASNGYICLVVDTLQLGEVAGIHHGTYREGRWWWHSRGYTPAGVECWNGIRGIDYLISRPDVDPERIGVTGISGGGATTVWVAAADDRVKVAVPVSGMSDLESYITNKVIDGHCDCMFFINTYQWEWTTALMLHAPKPLLFANSDNDRIFPMDGNRRIIDRLRKGYELLGKKENVEEYVSKGGHDYRPDLRVAVFAFVNKHLKGDSGPVKDADFPKIEGKELRVFAEDKDLPRLMNDVKLPSAINDFADDIFVEKAEIEPPKRKEAFAAWKARLVKQLRETSFRALPEKIPPAKKLREGLFSSENGISFGAAWDFSVVGQDWSGLVIANPEESIAEAGRFWVNRYRKDITIWALVEPRGGLTGRWTRKNPPNTVERSLALLGQAVDSGRVRDVASLLPDLTGLLAEPGNKEKVDPGQKPFKLRLMGRAQAGVIAAYAALLAPGGVNEVVILDPPTDHRHGPHFLNVERVLDLPTALGLLAPDVKLTLIGTEDEAFDKTAAIYKLAGAEGKFERK